MKGISYSLLAFIYTHIWVHTNNDSGYALETEIVHLYIIIQITCLLGGLIYFSCIPAIQSVITFMGLCKIRRDKKKNIITQLVVLFA